MSTRKAISSEEKDKFYTWHPEKKRFFERGNQHRLLLQGQPLTVTEEFMIQENETA